MFKIKELRKMALECGIDVSRVNEEGKKTYIKKKYLVEDIKRFFS